MRWGGGFWRCHPNNTNVTVSRHGQCRDRPEPQGPSPGGRAGLPSKVIGDLRLFISWTSSGLQGYAPAEGRLLPLVC